MRVKLAELLQQRINTLIFDEPTNHIDIPTKEVLEEAIEEFDGTLVFVSHDRYFINKFAQKIFEFENGSVTPYIGNYDDYKKKKEMGITDSIEDEHESKKNRKKDKAKDDDWER